MSQVASMPQEATSASNLGKLAEVAVSMTRFSLTILDVFTGLIDTMSPVINSLSQFGMSLESLKDWVYSLTGGSRKSDAYGLYLKDVADKDRLDKIENARATGTTMPAPDRDQLLAGSSARNARLAEFEKQREAYKAGGSILSMRSWANSDKEVAANVKDYMEPRNLVIDSLAQGSKSYIGSLRTGIQSIDDALQRFQTNGLAGMNADVPQNKLAIESIPKLLKMGGRYPDMAPALPITPKTGKMSEYFSPAAYRDEVMTRELNAAEQTATNTGTMAEQLSGIAATIDRMLQAPGAILTPLQMRAVTTI